jgi:hypothetical protein
MGAGCKPRGQTIANLRRELGARDAASVETEFRGFLA